MRVEKRAARWPEFNKRCSAKFSDKDGDRGPSFPLLSQPEEGQHGSDDNNQTDDVDDLVHGDLRFLRAVTITSIAQSSVSPCS